MRVAPLLCAMALGLWPGLVQAVEVANFTLKTTEDLYRVCSVGSDDPLRREALDFCEGFLLGVVGYHDAVTDREHLKPLICYPQTVTRDDGDIMFDISQGGRLLHTKDGELLAFNVHTGKSENLGDIERSTSSGRVQSTAWFPRWSPHGDKVAYLVSDGSSDEGNTVWVTDFKSAPRQVFHGWACWLAADGEGNLFILHGKPDMAGELWKVKWDGSGLTRVGTIPLLYNLNFVHTSAENQMDVSPDGNRVVIQNPQVMQENIGMIENLQ